MNITIPAKASNGTPGALTLNFTSAGFSILQSTFPFTLQVGSKTPQTVAVGQSIGAASGPPLGIIQFSNTLSVAIAVVIGDFGINQVTVTQAGADTIVGSNSQAIDLGSVVSPLGLTLPGTDSSGRKRKGVWITNYGRNIVGGATNNNYIAVYVNGQAGGVLWSVEAGTSRFLETSADLLVFALSNDLSTQPAHSMASVLEIFYSQSLQTNQ